MSFFPGPLYNRKMRVQGKPEEIIKLCKISESRKYENSDRVKLASLASHLLTCIEQYGGTQSALEVAYTMKYYTQEDKQKILYRQSTWLDDARKVYKKLITRCLKAETCKKAGKNKTGNGKIQKNPAIKENMINDLTRRMKENNKKLPWGAKGMTNNLILKKFPEIKSKESLEGEGLRLKDLMPEIKKRLKTMK